jgi:phage minor structural protein
MIAGGGCDLTMEHPIDPNGKWTHLIAEAIIKAPVPPETIASAISGLEADLYRTTTEAALRDGPSEPVRVTYSPWSQYNHYSVGSKVTSDNKNYECIYWDADSLYRGNSPASLPEWWKRIADYNPVGANVLVTLKAGTDIYYIEDAGGGWYKVTTAYGLEGYIKASQLTYIGHLTPSQTQPRKITEQLFRVKSVNVDTKAMTVSVTAEHVSYDMRGILVDDVKIVRRKPAIALAWIEMGFMMDYRGTIASNLSAETDTDYSAEIKGKNAVYALLDPDKGVVASCGAALRRDNWDVFVMRKTNPDRGFRLTYGNNVKGITWNTKSDSLVTRVVPVAKAADGSDLYLDPTKWVDSSSINNYPVIYMERLKVDGQVGKDDGTETGTNWTEATLRTEMEKKAGERFSVDKADQLQIEITVDFEMLGDTAEYAATMKDLERVNLYDMVTVRDARIGVNTEVEVTELEFDVVRKKVTAVKLANVNAFGGRNVSGMNVLNNSITGDKLTDDAGEAIANSAVNTATERSTEYTDDEINKVKAWVTANFEPAT